MNRVLLTLSLFACIVACSEKCTFTVKGTVEQGINIGDTVYLQYIDKGMIHTLGQTIVKGGKFSFTGEKCEPVVCYIVSKVNGKVRSNAEFFVEPGEIDVNIGAKRNKLAGTPLNIRLQEYNDSIDILDTMFKGFYDKSKVKTLSVKAAEEADKGMKVLSIVRKEYINRFMEKNIDNPVCAYILTKNHELIEPEEGIEIISRMPLENKCDTAVRHIEQTFRNKITTAEGKKFSDFEIYAKDGKRVKLSDFVGKGKVAVMNIWSTTGRNAKNDIAEFKALADAYKESVEFVGLAIEWDVKAWNAAIKENEMWWNHISDVQGWNSKAVFSYGVNSFPYNIVFAADGTIMRKGVKCSELYSILEEATKK